ncbi:MAG: DUF697 domain-containing protein [Pirellulaceae bacterium]|nr:DUF697 domain-containing protein [Planctomycetales bacterium]
MTETASGIHDPRYAAALLSVEHALTKYRGCTDREKEQLHQDLMQLKDMALKLNSGRVEIVVFGEISTGKSALVNALVGKQVASVSVQGGWTKQAWHVPWNGCGYVVDGISGSHVVLIDTPGLHEVGGKERAEIARDAAARADLIMFVTDSDLTNDEFVALLELAASSKPLLVVINKMDLYTPEQREQLVQVIHERLKDIVKPPDILTAAADPREIEYVIESADGSTRSQWRKPEPQIADVKARIVEVLERDGLALLALNAAMYAADKTDRVAEVRIRLREKTASQFIWSFAAAKAIAVAANPLAVADVIGGSAIDVSMVVTLAHVYGLEMSWTHARGLLQSIGKAAGWLVLAEWGVHAASGLFKTLTLGAGTAVTMLPQGAAAGYGSYIVGQAAKYFFEHGASWGSEAPKTVIKRILDQTDKESVIEHLKEEIRRKIQLNPHAR